MRLRILHETTYRYATPASRAIQILRLRPQGHEGQYIVNWRIEIDHDCRLEAASDPFGNAVHSFTAEGPLAGLTIAGEGEVETQDTGGVVRGQVDRLPPAVFLRDTALTTADAAIRDFADTIAGRIATGRVDMFHALMSGIRERLRFEVNATDTGTSAAEAFALRHGVCQDFAHIFVAAARHLGVPARYVSGYLFRPGLAVDEAGHAWAEVLIDDLGWVGFDAANEVCPTDGYVRLAVGLDYLGAAPVRGTRYGGTGETLAVRVVVTEAGRKR